MGVTPPYPVGPLMALRWPSSAIWSLSMGKKIISHLLGGNSSTTRRNLGGTNLELRQSCSAREASLPEGEIIVMIITNNSHLGEGNLHQHLQQHHLLLNPNSSLVFNLVTGTIDWYFWVTSSVDYIL